MRANWSSVPESSPGPAKGAAKKKAFMLLRQAAALGNAEAEYAIGTWYLFGRHVRKTDPFGEQACNNQTDCVEATNIKPQKSDGQTVTQSTNIDAAAVAELPKYESNGNTENGVRFEKVRLGTLRRRRFQRALWSTEM